jgi:hypothetical protein
VEDPNASAYGASQIIEASDYQAYYRASTSAPANLIEWQTDAGRSAVAYPSLSAFRSSAANAGRETASVERSGGTVHPYFVDYPARNFLQNPASTDVWGRGATLPSEVLKAVYWPQTAPAQPSARIGAIEWRDKPSATACGPSAPVYHLRNPANGSHLYTTSVDEVNSASTQYNYTEHLGIAFKAAVGPATGLSPVHRLYNPQTFAYLWTISDDEKQSAMTSYGYTLEGIGYYASTTAGTCLVPIYRLVHMTESKHYYTASMTEKNSLVAQGWTDEGIKFYAGSP